MAKKNGGQQRDTASIIPDVPGDVSAPVMVTMLQCMAGMERTLEVGTDVLVRSDVAVAWVAAGIAMIKGR